MVNPALAEKSLRPRRTEIVVPIENNHRVFAAIET